MEEITYLDLNFEKRPAIKCKHCGKDKGNHQAKTHNCPVGPKDRTLGYLHFDKTHTFEAKPSRTNKKKV